MGKQSDTLIHKLLAAEDRAERIVQIAREHRSRVVRDAHHSAEAEMDAIRAEEEAKLATIVASQTGSQEEAKIKAQTDRDIKQVQDDFNRNRAATAQYIFSKVMMVDKKLSQIQVASLTGH